MFPEKRYFEFYIVADDFTAVIFIQKRLLNLYFAFPEENYFYVNKQLSLGQPLQLQVNKLFSLLRNPSPRDVGMPWHVPVEKSRGSHLLPEHTFSLLLKQAKKKKPVDLNFFFIFLRAATTS